MLNNISFNKGVGGLGRPLPGKDHYSGLVFYGATPSGWNTGEVKLITSKNELSSLGLTSGILYEHIDEFFRIQPSGILYTGIWATGSATYSFSEVINLQNEAEGQIRQVLVVADQPFTSVQVGNLQTQATVLEGYERPTQFILESDFSGYTQSSAFPNIRVAGRKNVSVCISKDVDLSAGAGGTLLGAVALSKVSENIGWVEKFNVQAGSKYNDVQLQSGENLKDTTDAQLEVLAGKGYITLRTFTDYGGVYFVDSYTADTENSDYAYIENNRTIDKAIREVRLFLLPDLNRPITVEPDGTLSEGLITYFKDKCEITLQNMVNNSELSNYNVIINPLQNILSTSKLEITLQLLPIGVARFIEVNIGFTTSI